MSQLKKGAILSYVNIALTNFIGLLLTPFIIKSLGDSEYGLYTLIGSLVAYLTLMDLGLNNTIVRFVAKYRAEKDPLGESNFLGSIFIIYFIISIGIVLVGTYIYFSLENIFQTSLSPLEIEKAKVMFQILILNLAITLPAGAFTAICNAYEKFVFPRYVTIVKYLLRTLLVFLILTYGGKAIAIVVIDTVLNIAISFVIFIYVIKKTTMKVSFKNIDKLLFKKIFKYSIWIFLMGIIGQFFWNTGQIVLGLKTSTKLIAIYGLGITLGSYYGGFAGAINTVFLPRATKMSLFNSNEEIIEEMIKIGRILLIVLSYILIAFLLFGKEFIVLWVGEEYIDSWFVAAIIMLVYSIPLLQNFAHSIIEAKNKVAYKVVIYFIFISMGIALGYLLIDDYGVKGMAFGISIGWLIAQVFLNYFLYKGLNLNMCHFFKKIILDKLFLQILFLFFVSYFINFLGEGNWFVFIVKLILYSIVYISILISFGINKFEKEMFFSFLKIKKRE